jgi:hypothetical protein
MHGLIVGDTDPLGQIENHTGKLLLVGSAEGTGAAVSRLRCARDACGVSFPHGRMPGENFQEFRWLAARGKTPMSRATDA